MISPSLCEDLTSDIEDRLATLTAAERIVALELCRGLANKEIASVLGKHESTVKHQIASILYKMGAGSRFRLMAMLSEPSPLLATLCGQTLMPAGHARAEG